MIKVTVYFDTRFHTVNGKQDSVSFAVDSVEKVKEVISNANKMGNVSDIRIDHTKNGTVQSDYVFCVEKLENNQVIDRRFFIGENGNSFTEEEEAEIHFLEECWEYFAWHEVFFKNNYGWSF